MPRTKVPDFLSSRSVAGWLRGIFGLGNWLRGGANAVSAALFSPYGLKTLAACGLCLGLFYSLDWLWLRLLLGGALTWLLTLAGHSASGDAWWTVVDGVRWPMTAPCTYMDWTLCAAPFFWRPWRSFARNLGVIGAMALAVWGVNLARVYWAIAGNLAGVPWFWSHDVMDYVLWYPGLAVAICLWVRAVGRHQATATTDAQGGEVLPQRRRGAGNTLASSAAWLGTSCAPWLPLEGGPDGR